MVDPARLRALLSRLESRVRELEPYATMDLETFVADRRSVHASKYLLVTAIEDALAASGHVIASEGLRAPLDNADVFRSLRESRVIDAELADRLEGMARFRNLLIHVYADVDDRRVHGFLRTDLEDLRRLALAILELV
jgi:uncharacterized protein YutE (UPF0331/DUF86 family)